LFTRTPAGDGASQKVTIDPAGGASIELESLGAAGAAGVLAEMPTADAAAAIVVDGEAGTAAASCSPPITDNALVLGGSTMTGELLELVLSNPYAVPAVVSVSSSSENGDDSASEIASVLVPAGGVAVRDLAALLPLRQSLSVRLDSERGAFHAALVQRASGDVSIESAVVPGLDWWIPVMAVRNSTSRVVVATDSALPVEVQIDAYAAGAVTEAVFSGTVDARSQIDIPASELGGAPVGIRVSSDAPVAVSVVVDGEVTRAVAPATTLSTEWILPGALSGARLWVLNPGEVESELVLQPLSEGLPARSQIVPADSAISLRLESAGAGLLVRSSSEVALLWSYRAAGFELAAGTPLALLTE
jgi:hypothetical protein